MPYNDRVAFRPTAADLAHLAAIADGLRRVGVPFATRADAIRHSLEMAAAAATASGAPPEALKPSGRQLPPAMP